LKAYSKTNAIGGNRFLTDRLAGKGRKFFAPVRGEGKFYLLGARIGHKQKVYSTKIYMAYKTNEFL